MTLGERIKEHRNKLGFSQEKIAELVGVSRQAVTKWETNQSMPCMENLIALADIFGISLGELSGNINKEALNMRAVKSTWRTYGKITMILGASFLAATIILFIIRFIDTEFNPGNLPDIFGIMGAAWFIFGILFFISAKWESDKLKRLKKDGIRYDAKIERVMRNNYGIRMGSMISGYAECGYQNREEKICLVKSNSFLLEEQNPDYKASVYVNPNNPKDYAVEINIK